MGYDFLGECIFPDSVWIRRLEKNRISTGKPRQIGHNWSCSIAIVTCEWNPASVCVCDPGANYQLDAENGDNLWMNFPMKNLIFHIYVRLAHGK